MSADCRTVGHRLRDIYGDCCMCGGGVPSRRTAQPWTVDPEALLDMCDAATFDVVAVPPAILRTLVESYQRHQRCVELSIEEARIAGQVLAERDAAIAALGGTSA